MDRATPIVLVALGGSLGAVARFLVGDAVARRLGTSWPYGTLLINITGCLAIAVFVAAAAERSALHPGWRYLFPTGFVGAYTTFSTYEYETLRLVQLGETRGAAAYVVLSNLLGFVAVVFGTWVGRRL